MCSDTGMVPKIPAKGPRRKEIFMGVVFKNGKSV
jgi:hypothetical protein